MLSKLRLAHPFVFAILVYLLFFSGLNGTSYVLTAVVDTLNGGNYSALGDQAFDLACEVVPALLMCLVLACTGKLGLLAKRGRGFASGLACGGYCLGFIAYIAVQSVFVSLSEGKGMNPGAASVVCVLGMLATGVAEELEARAIIGETFLEHFGASRAGAIRAALASGLIFGLMHLTNVTNGDVSGTLGQVILCITGGILYGAIYFRCGNLWSIALIHGLNDVAASITIWLFNGGGALPAGPAEALTAESLIFPLTVGALDLIAARYVLRPKKAEQIIEAWPEIKAEGTQTDE